MTEGETTILRELRAIREELGPIRDTQQHHGERLTKLEAASGFAGQIVSWIIAAVVGFGSAFFARKTTGG